MIVREIVLALGSNIGDSEATLSTARQLVSERIGPVIASSRLIRTPAWGVEDQADFLNQVIAVRPDVFLSKFSSASLAGMLHSLLDITQAIEVHLGRERLQHWGPRTCDIDIIFVGRIRFESERLSLPHPWWRERDFVGGLIASDLPDFLPFGAP